MSRQYETDYKHVMDSLYYVDVEVTSVGLVKAVHLIGENTQGKTVWIQINEPDPIDLSAKLLWAGETLIKSVKQRLGSLETTLRRMYNLV